MMAYSNLALVEAELKSQSDNPEAAQVVEGKAYIITSALEWVTKRIDAICNQEFAPRRTYTYYDAPSYIVNDPNLRCVILQQPLLQVASVLYEDTLLTQWTPNESFATRASKDFYLTPIGRTPSRLLYPQTRYLTGTPVTYYGGNSQQVFRVDGLWGYREWYDRDGWADSGQTVGNNPLTISGTTVNVSSAAAFSPGMWVRFADAAFDYDDEIALITAVDGTSMQNTLTVDRGQRGTTATAHVAGTALDIWQTEPNINRAATRWCAYLYQRRAVYESVQVTLGAGSGGIAAAFPQDAPEEIMGILGKYMNNWYLGTSGWTG